MSAIVLAALVVMWAVVLVPMFLRRSERVHELDGAARFAGAMRVLSRRRRGALGSGAEGAAAAGVPAGERRAAVISRALAAAPARPIRREVPPAVAVRRRAARVAARRRGLGVMVGAMLLSAIVAVLVGGWLWAVQGAVDVFAVAGLLQIRASALADRYERGLPRAAPRPETRVVPEPAAAQRVAPAVGRPATAVFTAPQPQVAAAVAPTVERPAYARPAAAATPAPAAAAMPADYYDAPAAPRRPERIRGPLLDPVDSDPATMTDGLELLDGILGRAAGQ